MTPMPLQYTQAKQAYIKKKTEHGEQLEKLRQVNETGITSTYASSTRDKESKAIYSPLYQKEGAEERSDQILHSSQLSTPTCSSRLANRTTLE